MTAGGYLNGNKYRTAKRYRKGEWRPVEFWQIEVGDLCQFYEHDGNPVIYKGQTILEAQSRAYRAEDGNWNISVGVKGSLAYHKSGGGVEH